MEYLKLRNPAVPNGGDIDGNFVAREDEIKKEDEKTKELLVINAKKVVFPAGTEKVFDIKTAKYILRTWGFVQQIGSPFELEPNAPDPVGEVEEEFDNFMDELEEEETSIEEEVEEEKLEETEEEEYERLKTERAWLNPLYKNRYNELKDKFKK